MELQSIFPALPKTERGKPVVLGPHPKGDTLLYTNGHFVIVRNLKELSKSYVYSEHSYPATVAKFSPSTYYVASADQTGKVRIWDTTQDTHVLKAEYQPFCGPVCDIDWSEDSKRLVLGGQGNSKFGAAILVDTGASVGEIMGMGKKVNSLSMKPNRPYRLATGTEDNLVCFFTGPPFKFTTSTNHHQNFVNSVRYSRDGSVFVSGSADGKLYSYDGSSGEMLAEIGPNAHKAGIYAVEFSPDGHFMISGSADKSLKCWRLQGTEFTLHSTYQFPNELSNMIVSVTWVGEKIVVCTLDSYLHLFDGRQESLDKLSEGPQSTLFGHSMAITCTGFNHEHKSLITASADGKVAQWSNDTPGTCHMLVGAEGHKNVKIQSMTTHGNLVATVGIDDRLAVASLADREFTSSVKLESQPQRVAYASRAQLLAVVCLKELLLYRVKSDETAKLEAPLVSVPVKGDPTVVAITQSGSLVVIGQDDGTMAFYDTKGGTALQKLDNVKECLGHQFTDMQFSPNDKMLAVCDLNRTVTVFELENFDPAAPGDFSGVTLKNLTQQFWRFHSARVLALAWNPDNRRLASGSLDCSIIVWNLDEPRKRVQYNAAHPISQVNGLAWENENKLFSVGQDASVRVWNVPKP